MILTTPYRAIIFICFYLFFLFFLAHLALVYKNVREARLGTSGLTFNGKSMNVLYLLLLYLPKNSFSLNSQANYQIGNSGSNVYLQF